MRRARVGFSVLVALLVLTGGMLTTAVRAQETAEAVQPGESLPGDVSVQLVQVADGLIDPINLAAAPDESGRLFIIERTGTIRILQEGQVLEEPFLDISSEVKIDFLEQGLLAMAFHPDYAENGLFYVNYTDYRTNGTTFVVEYAVSADDPNVADPESARVVLTVDQPYVNHNGGTLHFGPDGYLYIALGDGGLAGDSLETAQNINDLLGSLLRIDVNVDAESDVPYLIPPDNPFAESSQTQTSSVANQAAQTGGYKPEARPEIWAYGLRNPWQFSFDPATGDLYIPDVGQVAWEEINFQAADAGGGQNYGWDFLEGAHCYPPDEADACALVGALPVAEYQHEDGSCSITGIGVYRGAVSASLDGIYFSSDFCSGKVWGLVQDDGGAWQYAELLDTELLATGSGQDAAGELYMTACTCEFGRDYNPFENPTGTVWQLMAAEDVPEGAVTAPVTTPEAEEGATPEVEDEGVATPEDDG